MIAKILTALIEIPKLVGLVESFAAEVSRWYCARATTETCVLIADAAALAAKAENDEDRYKASEAWQTAFSRPRVRRS